MTPAARRSIAITGAVLVTILASWVFYKSIKEGSPNWNLLILASGMAFLLYVIAISGKKKRRR